MKSKIICLLIVTMFLMSISARNISAAYEEVGTKTVTLDSGVTASFKIGPYVKKKVKIIASADRGSVLMEVLNDEGKVVARGFNLLNFRTGSQSSRYRIVFTNSTNQMQTIIVSYTATDDLWT